MFLNLTKRRNQKLIETGLTLHQHGNIPPNTYVIDVDIVRENVRKLVKTAKDHNMVLYFMTKQLGRIPEIAQIIVEEGIESAVAVDFDEGKILADHGIKIGNIGHLVQPGVNQWPEVLKWNPEIVTIFSYERAKQLSEFATELNISQDIILKIYDKKDKFYPGQEGGILLGDLKANVEMIKSLPNISIVGVTTFPNLKLNDQCTKMIPTNNLETLLRGTAILKQLGIQVKQVNGPAGTSCETIPFLSSKGITHGEPGHGITGTTPLHAFLDLPEKPAMIYVTEVSHEFEGKYQVIAGGYYGRSNMKGCFVGRDEKTICSRYTTAETLDSDSIDYYGLINKSKNFNIRIGDTAIFAFRAQAFVTRSHIALVEGIQQGKPQIIHFERN